MRLASLCFLSLFALHCGAPIETSDVGELPVGDDKADSAALSRKVGNLTVTLDASATFVEVNATVHLYRLRGTTSKNVDSVFAFVPDDAFAEARTTGKRSFEILVRQGHELNTLLSGLPLFVSVDPASGPSATIAVWLAPRYVGFAGTSSIRLDAAIKPIWAGGDVIYRAGAQLKNGYTHLQASTDDDINPYISRATGNDFRVDLTYRELELAADPPEAPIFFHAYKPDGTSANKTARIGVSVSRFEITSGDAYDVWPNDCVTKVGSCIKKELGKQNLDLATCGSYRQVLACGPVAMGQEPSRDQVAADLRAHLVDWYKWHGADVPPEANTLVEAQAAVGVELLSPVLYPIDDPEAHPAYQFWIFRHPDPVHIGGDTAFFLAYDKLTGKLVQAYDFN